MVAGVTREPYGMRPLYGFLHPILASYTVASFALAAATLARQYRYLTGFQKTQAGYLFVAFIVPGVLAATTNIFVPLVAGTSAYNGFGPVFSLIMVAMIAHAIIRHRFMDIRVVIRRGVVYLVTFLSSAALFVTLLFGSNFLLPLEHGFSLRDITLALIVALAFQPVKSRVQQILDRYLYREPYDYPRTVRDASRALTATIDLQELLGHVGSALTSTLRPDGMSIYLLDPEDHEFRLAWRVDSGTFAAIVPITSPLVSIMSTDRLLVFRDEIGHTRAADPSRLLRELDQLRAEVVVPIVRRRRAHRLPRPRRQALGRPVLQQRRRSAHDARQPVRGGGAERADPPARGPGQRGDAEGPRDHRERRGRGRAAAGASPSSTARPSSSPGQSAQVARGQSPERLPSPLGSALHATAADGEPRSQVEFSLPDAAGQMVPLMCSTSPLRGPAGRRWAPSRSSATCRGSRSWSRRSGGRSAWPRSRRSRPAWSTRSGIPLVGDQDLHPAPAARVRRARSSGTSSRRSAGREIARIDDLLSRFRTMSAASQHPMETVDLSDPLRDTLEPLQPRSRTARSSSAGSASRRDGRCSATPLS